MSHNAGAYDDSFRGFGYPHTLKGSTAARTKFYPEKIWKVLRPYRRNVPESASLDSVRTQISSSSSAYRSVENHNCYQKISPILSVI